MRTSKVKYKCKESGCEARVYKKDERCWKCWARLRDERIARIMREEKP